MSDFTVSVGIDYRETLDGFRQLEQEAQKVGQVIGQRIDEGVRRFSTTSLAGLQAELGRLQQKQATVGVDTKAFDVLGQRIREIQSQLEAVQRKQLSIGVDDRSIQALQTKLSDLQSRQTKLDVDGSEFKAVTQEITQLQQQVSAVERKKLLINADPSSIALMQSKIGDLREELNRVAVGSQRFKELQKSVQDAERELDQATQSTDGFRLLDGVIQGVAFSLTNSVTNAAGQALAALQGLINGFARLDTEIRQAAAAGGEAGGYDRLSRVIDQVGIEASGTTLEVAQLATELVRGGMTIDQVNDSLGAIVRGAEATGTGFAEMGSVVSASIKGFGLAAADSQRVVDALVTGANASATSVTGMGEAFKYAAPVARILGVSIEELGVTVGLMTNSGIQASEAGVTLRNGLSKLASAAPSTGSGMQQLTGQAAMAAKTMRQLGLDIYESDGTLKPMEETLLKLKGAFDTLNPATKIRMAANMFGGEDDGAKWLALLNQSKEEIKKMSATMANTKGATDTARQAMQGFELITKQLGGTIDSLGNTLGSVAAAALLPLINAANAAVGVVAALPGPVKAVGSALILVTGAAVAAATAVALFQRAATFTKVQTAALEILELSRAFRGAFVGGVQAAAAAIPGLLTQLQLLGELKFSALATTLKTAVVNGFTAASAAIGNFIAYLRSAQFASFVAGVKSAVVALAPMALALGFVAAAVAVWQQTLSGAQEVQQAFTGIQKDTATAIQNLNDYLKTAGGAFDDLEKSTLKTTNQFQLFWNSLKEGMLLRELALQAQQLEGSTTKALELALEFNNAMKNQRTITEQQGVTGTKLVQNQVALAKAFKDAAAEYRKQEMKAQAEGNINAANAASRYANSMELQAQSHEKAAAAIRKRLPEELQQITMDQAASQAIDRRIKAEQDLARLISEAPKRQLDQQIAVGQQLVSLSKAAADVEQSRFSVTRSRLQFELQALQDRGAGEAVIAAKKAEMDRVDREALAARYQALQQEQKLQAAMLAMSQQKAQLEASLAVEQAQVDIDNAKRELRQKEASGTDEEKQAAQAVVTLQEKILSIKQESLSNLAQTQPLEAAIASLQREQAMNGIQAEAAAKGLQIAANGTDKSMKSIAESGAVIAGRLRQSLTSQRELLSITDKQASQRASEQLAVGQQLMGLARAMGDEQQSRFAIRRAEINYDLQKAQERGASETEIAQIKQMAADNDREAAAAKFRSLLQQQQMELAILAINQRKAQIDAAMEVGKQRLDLLKAQRELQVALVSGDAAAIAGARAGVQLQQAMVQQSQNKAQLLLQMQPLEQQALQLQQATARNGEQATAISNGYRLNLNQTVSVAAALVAQLQNVPTVVDQSLARQSQYNTALDRVTVVTAKNVQEMIRYVTAAKNAGMAVQALADGTVVFGESQQDVAAATEQIARAGATAGGPINDAAVKRSKDFAQSLDRAYGFAAGIDQLGLKDKFAAVASSTGQAATSAKDFYGWLKLAASLPAARWSGGPVEAGGEYRINELGQEAFLAAGRLSLIDAPANSVWRAPSAGVVIPAGITARLQGTAPLSAGGGLSGVAELAVEVGNLRQEVAGLARKDWSIHVQQRTGPTASQVMNQIHRLR